MTRHYGRGRCDRGATGAGTTRAHRDRESHGRWRTNRTDYRRGHDDRGHTRSRAPWARKAIEGQLARARAQRSKGPPAQPRQPRVHRGPGPPSARVPRVPRRRCRLPRHAPCDARAMEFPLCATPCKPLRRHDPPSYRANCVRVRLMESAGRLPRQGDRPDRAAQRPTQFEGHGRGDFGVHATPARATGE